MRDPMLGWGSPERLDTMSACVASPLTSALHSSVVLSRSRPKSDYSLDPGSPAKKVSIPFHNAAIAVEDVLNPISDLEGKPLLKFAKGAKIVDIVRSP